MSSGKFLSARGSGEVERKCSLLAKFIADTNDRAECEEQVRQNLSTYLCEAQKVKLRVGRHAVTITDRKIWQHKIDRIPNSLIVDAYVDSEYQQICYFVNETVRGSYRVLVSLCKTAEDANRLVSSCQYHNREMERYRWWESLSMLNPSYEGDSTEEWTDDCSSLGIKYNQNKTNRHSGMVEVPVHGYCYTERQPRMANNAGWQYEGGQRDDKAARIFIRENKPGRHRNTRGITFIKPRGGVKNSGFQKVIRSGKVPTKGSQGTIQMSGSPSGNYYHSKSNSPRWTDPNFVEEEFKFVPTEQNRSLSLPRQGGRKLAWESQMPNNFGVNIVQTSSEDNIQRRKKGPYRSIKEYEEAQKNMTISSSGLHTTSSSENISPQMTLVLQGNNYSIRDTGRSHSKVSRQPIQLQKSGTRQRNRLDHGLHLIEAGRFPVVKQQPPIRSSAHVPPRQQMAHQPPGVDGQLQVYSPDTVPQTQPLYRTQTRGKGKNFFKNEALEYDDNHKYFRQHGQRFKKTSDGRQKLYLDKRLAETKDVIGDQMVEGKHSQKVQSGESVGANHHSKFHSEVRVSHKTSMPTGTPQFPTTNTEVAQTPHRKNSHPVKTTTHHWPPSQFTDPKLHFNNNFAKFPTNEPLQRFFTPEYYPMGEMRLQPGFERFFTSINNFGPQSGFPTTPEKENIESPHPKIMPKTPTQYDSLQRAGHHEENDSETSSIRSSASAYWPPELKFLSAGKETDALSWKYRRPVMKLRRISPLGEKRER